MRNWKTTLGGVAALLTLAVKVINGAIEGRGLVLDGEDLAVGGAAFGLLFAKDHNVSGTGK